MVQGLTGRPSVRTMRCIIHCGAPKTGTSALQKALFFNLKDPRFQYFSGGYIDNGSHALEALFAEEPYCRRLYENHLASSRGRFPLYRQRLQRRLDQAVARCRRRDADLILSAEGLWRASPEAFSRFRRLRAYLVDQGFDVVLIAYLRPLLPWLASLYQQSLKFGNAQFGLEMFRELLNFQAIIEELWLVFGRANVSIYPYDTALFPGGCVVRHFCHEIGYRCPPGYRTSVNESLSRSACGLLLAYNRQRPLLPTTGMHQAVEYAPILRHLQRLPGPSLRLHPTVLERWAPTLVRQGDWLERELGLRLSPSATEATAVSSIPPPVGSADELLAVPQEALQWLGERSGVQALASAAPPRSERLVALAMRRLTGRWSHRLSLPRRASQRLQARLIHLQHGC